MLNTAGKNPVAKIAEIVDGCRRQVLPFANGRTAFKAFMVAAGLTSADEVLLPAYVGWSSREGSGVFDPVAELGLRYAFYRTNDRLEIDVEDAMAKIIAHRPRLLVLIHYFGFPDARARELAEFARQHEVLVLEDEAHAMLSDWIAGGCGRWGDGAIMSLHKLLPFPSGGLLVLNATAAGREIGARLAGTAPSGQVFPFCDYDLYEIARRRRANANIALTTLSHLGAPVEPLYHSIPETVVPQTLPVLISGRPRDDIYFEMNSAGFGVVSLYHTLVAQIDGAAFPESHRLSRRIMNLPVHQDAAADSIVALVEHLAGLFE